MAWLRRLIVRVQSRVGTSSGAVAKLLSGSLIAQLIVVGVSPILTRIYSPAELGTFAAFMALVGPVALLATGGYPQAVVLPDVERRTIELVAFVLALITTVSIATAILVFASVPLLGSDRESLRWLYWLPLGVAVAGANAVLVSLANRQSRYGLIASTSVVRSAAQAVGQVGVGLVAPSATALVGVSTLASAVSNVRLVRNYIVEVRHQRLTTRGILAAAKDYNRFPKYTLPAGFLSQAHLAGLPLAIGAIYGASTLGLWSLAQRLLATPLTVLGSAIGDVYFRRATELRRSGGDSLLLYRRVLVWLSVLSAPPFIALAVFAPWLFSVVFGPEWEQAGLYARILIPWLWVRFLTSPLSRTTLVFERNRLGLWNQAALAMAALGTVLASWQADWNFSIFLTVLSVLQALVYGSLLLVYARVIRVAK